MAWYYWSVGAVITKSHHIIFTPCGLHFLWNCFINQFLLLSNRPRGPSQYKDPVGPVMCSHYEAETFSRPCYLYNWNHYNRTYYLYILRRAHPARWSGSTRKSSAVYNFAIKVKVLWYICEGQRFSKCSSHIFHTIALSFIITYFVGFADFSFRDIVTRTEC